MSTSSPLRALRDASIKKTPINFYIVEGEQEQQIESIKDATHAKFGPKDELFALNTLTNFYNEGNAQPLKAVIFCWLNDKSSIVDYKNKCLEYNIPDFKFLVKAELTTWLNGSSETCTFIKEDKSSGEKTSVADSNSYNSKKSSNEDSTSKTTLDTAAATAASSSTSTTDNSKKRKLDDPQLIRISEFERESIDHNAALRGTKNIDFGYLVSDAKRFINQLKGSKSSKSSSSKSNDHLSAKKQPIIVLSPATTSLISLTNIKEFLENGKFVEPSAVANKKPSNGIVNIHHNSEKLISAGHHFMVVDNVDIFTKPEYWDRVVAIFTTGQTWQFAKYRYSKPEELFQRYAGYYVSHQGDVTPKQIKDWNITEIKVDRGDKRFRDKMIVRDFWADMEKILLSKGFGKQ